MTMKRIGTERFSLARWSRRKLASALDPPTPSAAAAATAPSAATAAAAPPSAAAAVPAAPLPPIESLTFDSDFAAFLKPGVDPMVKREALKKLFRDPRFNVMDGLDTYIDDYTKADPIPEDMLADLLERFDRSCATAEGDDTDAARAEAAAVADASGAAGLPASVECDDTAPRSDDMSRLAEPTAPPAVEGPRASAGEPMPSSDASTRGASG
jgi:hypothetical protein